MIDINTLHIGSHVSIGGKMHRVAAIDELNGQMGIEAYKTDTNGVKHPFGYKFEDINPIPLTAELLQELGFEHGSDNREWHKYIGEVWIGILLFFDRERMRVNICDDNTDYWSCNIRYLHELEDFVYLIIQKGLVE